MESFKWPKAGIAGLGPMICTTMSWLLRRIACKCKEPSVLVFAWCSDRNRKIACKPINIRTFNFYKLKYRHKYRHLVVSCRFIEICSNLESLLLPSYSAHLKLYLHPTPSKFKPSQTPPTPYSPLLAMGLPSTFAY